MTSAQLAALLVGSEVSIATSSIHGIRYTHGFAVSKLTKNKIVVEARGMVREFDRRSGFSLVKTSVSCLADPTEARATQARDMKETEARNALYNLEAVGVGHGSRVGKDYMLKEIARLEHELAEAKKLVEAL